MNIGCHFRSQFHHLPTTPIAASKTFPPVGLLTTLSTAANNSLGSSWIILSEASNVAPAAIPAGTALPVNMVATAPAPITTKVLVAALNARLPPS
ncbi:hypothetical protein DERF_006359 [Dermatophagoides farinae]|uniref:Uncharacterized protein n=1 Tax=Dermatophagoides farinae TaxID=6954 RepID=A0A922I8Q9_DERFA|nr:hypothetical protein DERF_006359 [Dermatophagoides farinae]